MRHEINGAASDDQSLARDLAFARHHLEAILEIASGRRGLREDLRLVAIGYHANCILAMLDMRDLDAGADRIGAVDSPDVAERWEC